MSSNTRKFSPGATHFNASRNPFSAVQSSSGHTSRESLGTQGSPTSGATRSARLEDRHMDSQKALKFRANILALDPHAKFPRGNTLDVIHSKCGGVSTQRAVNDISNFREHVGICKGIPASFIHPTAATLARPTQPPCPGFNFGDLFGKDYKSLSTDEREKVTRAAKVTGFTWLNSREGGSVISASCLKTSCQEPARPCNNCVKLLELSGFKNTLRGRSPRPATRYSPFLSTGVN